MVIGPSFDGIEHYSLVGKGAVGRIAGGVIDKMGIAGGIGEIVFAFVFVHPGGFEKAFVVVFFGEELAVLIYDLNFFYGFAEVFHVLAEFRDPRKDGGFGRVGEACRLSHIYFYSSVVVVLPRSRRSTCRSIRHRL